MHLKRLELIGFKSFAQKVNLDFPGGIVGIVGPNGSGKSNVIDAIRWILGEREAKNLRGGKAEDLIFAGTHQRPKMGMAQVTLNFDNSSGFFPVDFSEVSVMRRIERDGNSHYFLNKSEVRLKDIIDFFAQARLGTKGLTIINQGESDLFVRAIPLQRREMIEEILGLRQYQLKKHEAKRKLKNTLINAEKVKAMVNEITPHLRFLKKQTAKWEKLSEIEKDLKDNEDIYFKNKLKEIRGGASQFEPKIKEVEQKILNKEKELKELQSVLAKVENLQPTTQVQVSDTQKRRDELLIKRSALEKEMGRLEAKLEFISVSDSANKTAPILLQEIKDNLHKIIEEKDFNAVQVSLKALLLKIDKFLRTGGKEENKEHIEIEKSKNDLCVQLEEIAKELKKISEQESDSRSHLENFNASFKKAFGEVEAKKDEITALENDKNKLLFEIERFNLKMQDLEAAVRQAGRDIEEFKKDFESVTAADDLFGLERKIFKLRSEIAGIGEIDEALLKEAKETESRFNFLSGQLVDLQKATDDLESLIKDLDLKIHNDFSLALKKINEEFNKFFELMFGGGRAKLVLEKPVKEIIQPGEEKSSGENSESAVSGAEEDDNDGQIEMGVEIELSLPRKKIKGLDMLSGGEKSLVSIAALFALISVSPPPFLVLDEVDAALDERNTKRFAELIKDFSKETQFVVVTHNRATMESADVLYGITMEEDGVSKVLSLKMEA